MAMRCFAAAVAIGLSATMAFTPPRRNIISSFGQCKKCTDIRPNRAAVNCAMKQERENDDDDELDELSPPSIAFTRNSILFGDDPPTQKRNGPLVIWQQTKSLLPKFVTGAWENGKGDRDPLEHLYNLVFVRIPVVLMGMVYVNNLIHGHPLLMNFGGGTVFEIPAIIVLGIIYVILR
eukprot:CCRYP_004894-RA/>CCRYP_004894-RA protein AED:0.16 eAED:0.16 QI:0/-1/0/1/-1/1/1/0/177